MHHISIMKRYQQFIILDESILLNLNRVKISFSFFHPLAMPGQGS